MSTCHYFPKGTPCAGPRSKAAGQWLDAVYEGSKLSTFVLVNLDPSFLLGRRLAQSLAPLTVSHTRAHRLSICLARMAGEIHHNNEVFPSSPGAQRHALALMRKLHRLKTPVYSCSMSAVYHNDGGVRFIPTPTYRPRSRPTLPSRALRVAHAELPSLSHLPDGLRLQVLAQPWFLNINRKVAVHVHVHEYGHVVHECARKYTHVCACKCVRGCQCMRTCTCMYIHALYIGLRRYRRITPMESRAYWRGAPSGFVYGDPVSTFPSCTSHPPLAAHTRAPLAVVLRRAGIRRTRPAQV